MPVLVQPYLMKHMDTLETSECIKIEEEEVGTVQWSGFQCVGDKVKTEPGPINNLVWTAGEGLSVAPSEV